ncbi:MAG TPA: hypothetical protein VGZ28_12885 [Terriglobales bacterium]|jgi:hypothetical protein|nr:hypothetical protein [Terriglobales bacterium]
MKNLVGRTLTALLLGVLSLGPAARAQSIERVIKANIPFEFSVGRKTFPAGNYRLVSVSPEVLQLRDAEGRVLTWILTNSVETPDAPGNPKLLFYGQDGRYVLTEVWHNDLTIGQQLPLPKSLEKVGRRKAGHTEIVAAETAR